MPTQLCHDLAYLKRLLSQAIRLHQPNNMEEATMLADTRDYIMYLCLDAQEDHSLARTLVHQYAQLGLWLRKMDKDMPVWKDEKKAFEFYRGFIFALEQLLSLRHEITVLPAEKISRQDFTRSWKETARKLGLD